ncbi:rCG53654 [Rattus norvegicus]|uniref:RCG53654 n=1 Tax=Rattus norvegicus TaxID=10116 RepID=A6J9G0_RAT|nr:rCG53654 [Rattus norvegicus]
MLCLSPTERDSTSLCFGQMAEEAMEGKKCLSLLLGLVFSPSLQEEVMGGGAWG